MKLLPSFLDYLTVEKNYSSHTICSYRRDIEQCVAHVGCQRAKEIEFVEISHVDIRRWVSAMMSEGISARTINRKLCALHAYAVFLLKRQYIQINPVSKVVRPKVRKKLAPFVRETEMDALFDEMLPEVTDCRSARTRLILELLYLTGVRLSELIHLRAEDFDWSLMQVKVVGKGCKERVIPVGEPIRKTLAIYLSYRKHTGDYLLLTDKGEPLYPKFVYRLVRDSLSQVSNVDMKGPHTLRHSFATCLLSRGADINAIKELLGHVNLASTQVYTHNTMKEVSNIFKQAHPRA